MQSTGINPALVSPGLCYRTYVLHSQWTLSYCPTDLQIHPRNGEEQPWRGGWRVGRNDRLHAVDARVLCSVVNGELHFAYWLPGPVTPAEVLTVADSDMAPQLRLLQSGPFLP